MSTIGYESWAVDLAEVGPVYPLQGWEVPMVALGVIFWLAWHAIQFRRESAHLAKAREMGDSERVHAVLDRY